MKCLKSKFQEIHHIAGAFHINELRDLRNGTIILGDKMESSNLKILLRSKSRSLKRANKPWFTNFFNKNLVPHQPSGQVQLKLYLQCCYTPPTPPCIGMITILFENKCSQTTGEQGPFPSRASSIILNHSVEACILA